MKRLMQALFATQPNEIQCDEAAIQMIHCFSANLSSEEARRQYPQLWHHFRFCLDCAEEYEMMMEMARMAAAGQVVQPDQAPPAPDKPSIWDRLRDAVTLSFPGFTPELAAAVQRGSDTGFEPVSLPLIPDILYLDLDVAINSDDPELRNLFCTAWTEDTELETAFEGSSIWLQVGEAGAVTHEAAFNEVGDVTLSHLTPGQYDLGVSLARQTYLVRGLTVP